MQRTLCGICGVVLLLSMLSTASEAQMVRVGPGYVRAPFASVDWFPNGVTHVRAPFVNLYGPTFPPFYRQEVQKPADDCAQMSWQSLSQEIWKWSGQLDLDLERVPNGSVWQQKLKTAEIAGLVDTTADVAPPEANRAKLQEILESQQAALHSFQGRRIGSLPSLGNLQAALAEYVTPPEQRMRRQLYTAANELNASLERFTTGEDWQKFLTVSPGMTLSSTVAEDVTPAPDAAELSKSLARFESVEQSPEYQKIAAVPAFKTTRARLTAYLAQQPVGDQPVETGAVPVPEELPAPLPTSTP